MTLFWLKVVSVYFAFCAIYSWKPRVCWLILTLCAIAFCGDLTLSGMGDVLYHWDLHQVSEEKCMGFMILTMVALLYLAGIALWGAWNVRGD